MRRTTPILFWILLVAIDAGVAAAKPLRVVATTPDLGSLVKSVGGDEVDVTVLTKGPQDPHFVEPRPSFVRKLHDADLYVQNGLELEAGWAPVLLRQARNADVMPGAGGHVDASVAIRPLQVPTGPTDRSRGDVHPYGNPHYLTDPLNGLRVAALLRDTLVSLRPADAAGFRERYAVFEEALVSRLVGAALFARHGSAPLTRQIEAGRLDAFLEEQGDADELAGWLGALHAHAGTNAVQDHQMWVYFTSRFGLELIDALEPKPGIAPTTRHLAQVVARVEAENGRVILASPYFDARHTRWVSERTGIPVAEMAHQVGGREGTADYLATVDYNVRQLREAL